MSAGCVQFERLVNFQFLNKDQLKLAEDFVIEMMSNQECEEYYFDMFEFIQKCHKVFKKQSYTKLGLTVCNKKVVDFVADAEHKDCHCSSVSFNTSLLS